jgi:hypothetical protein
VPPPQVRPNRFTPPFFAEKGKQHILMRAAETETDRAGGF